MALSSAPIDVITDRPSLSTATPSSSVGPKVICSGCPSVDRWRHRWLRPSTAAVKYIQEPSGDQPADVHAPLGPTGLASPLPASEMRLHGAHPPSSSISTTKADLWSGEA